MLVAPDLASPAIPDTVTAQAIAGIEPLLQEMLVGLAPTPARGGSGRPRSLPSAAL